MTTVFNQWLLAWHRLFSLCGFQYVDIGVDATDFFLPLNCVPQNASSTCSPNTHLTAVLTPNTQLSSGCSYHRVKCPWLAPSCSSQWCSAWPWLRCAPLQGGSFVRLPPCAALKQELLAYIWPSISLVTVGLRETAPANVLQQMTDTLFFIARGCCDCCYCPPISAVNTEKITA